MKYSPSNRLLFIANSTRLASPNCYVISTITGEDNSTADDISNCLFIGSFLFNCIPTSSVNSMSPKSSKRKSSSSKKHVSSDEEDNLTISDEDVEFLDQGVVKKVKKPTACLRRVNSNTPCWKFFEIPQGEQRASKCKKCDAMIT